MAVHAMNAGHHGSTRHGGKGNNRKRWKEAARFAKPLLLTGGCLGRHSSDVSNRAKSQAKLERRRASRALKFSLEGLQQKKGRRSQAMSEPPSPRLTGSQVCLPGMTTLFGLSQMHSVMQARLRNANSLALTALLASLQWFAFLCHPL